MADMLKGWRAPGDIGKPFGARLLETAISELHQRTGQRLIAGSLGMPGLAGKVARPSSNGDPSEARQFVTEIVDLGGSISRGPSMMCLKSGYRLAETCAGPRRQEPPAKGDFLTAHGRGGPIRPGFARLLRHGPQWESRLAVESPRIARLHGGPVGNLLKAAARRTLREESARPGAPPVRHSQPNSATMSGQGLRFWQRGDARG